jgi:urease accessory protein
MSRAIKVLRADQPRDRKAVDTAILTLDHRRMHQGDVCTAKGERIVLDLAPPVWLHTDDALVLDDGRLIDIVAAPEPLLEVRAADGPTFLRIAWLLGDHHVPTQILRLRLRTRNQPTVAALLSQHAIETIEIEAPFDPEGGAYASDSQHRHDHRHDHAGN